MRSCWSGRDCWTEDRRQIPNRQRSHLIPYNTTALERDLALSLGIPMYGADPRLAELGTKTGCRRLFAEEGVAHPLGDEDLHSLDEVTEAIVEMLARRPTMAEVIVKLNEGVSGAGNALVDLRGVDSTGLARSGALAIPRVRSMQLESDKIDPSRRTWPSSSGTAASSRSGSSARSC